MKLIILLLIITYISSIKILHNDDEIINKLLNEHIANIRPTHGGNNVGNSLFSGFYNTASSLTSYFDIDSLEHQHGLDELERERQKREKNNKLLEENYQRELIEKNNIDNIELIRNKKYKELIESKKKIKYQDVMRVNEPNSDKYINIMNENNNDGSKKPLTDQSRQDIRSDMEGNMLENLIFLKNLSKEDRMKITKSRGEVKHSATQYSTIDNNPGASNILGSSISKISSIEQSKNPFNNVPIEKDIIHTNLSSATTKLKNDQTKTAYNINLKRNEDGNDVTSKYRNVVNKNKIDA